MLAMLFDRNPDDNAEKRLGYETRFRVVRGGGGERASIAADEVLARGPFESGRAPHIL